MPALIAKKLRVNKIFQITTEPMQLYSESSKSMVDIPIPTSHMGVSSIQCRLMSAEKRKGMVKYSSNRIIDNCSSFIKIETTF